VEKAHGTTKLLWPLFERGNMEAGCQTCHAADMVLVSNDVAGLSLRAKTLPPARLRRLSSLRRLRQEPEDLLSVAQRSSSSTRKKGQRQEAGDLMKQADKAESNEEANHLNDRAVALKVSNSKLDLAHRAARDRSTKSLLEDMKKVGPNLKDLRLKLNKTWIPCGSGSQRTSAHHKMPNFRLNDDQIKLSPPTSGSRRLSDSFPSTSPETPRHGKELFETRGCLACHSIGEGDTCRRNVCREPHARRRKGQLRLPRALGP